jgi:3-deoxy-D-manno-octulosonate 8-phosphate phosphatase (KDO 8-P phosphatase)
VTDYAGPIRLLLLDVDGVLTDGALHIGPSGEAVKVFNVRDGVAVGLLRAHGIQTGLLSGRASAPLDERIRSLGIGIARTGRLDKPTALAEILAEAGLPGAAVAYVGDDVVDLELIGLVGRFYAPADAHPLVLARADHVLTAAGGRGAGREAAEDVLLTGGLTLEEAYRPLMDQWGARRVVQ